MLDTWLAEADADMAFLLIKGRPDQAGENFCRVGGIAFVFDPANPIAISADNYALADITVLHEIGHVFGGRHPSWPANVYSVPVWARGYLAPGGLFQTIMGAYDGLAATPPVPQCVFGADGSIPAVCPRIAYFSNPAITYNGLPTGTPYHNMKYWLDDLGAMREVSAWQENSPSAPAAPVLSVQSELCYGLHQAQWSAQINANHYRLLWSSTSDPATATEVYNGTDTQAMINVTGSRFLWVKACNSHGCSAVSNRVKATAINTCM